MNLEDIKKELEALKGKRFNRHTLVRHVNDTFKPNKTISRLNRGTVKIVDWELTTTLYYNDKTVKIKIFHLKLIPNHYEGKARFENIYIIDTDLIIE